MKIRHLLSNTSSRKEGTEIPGFLLRNQVGDFVSFYPERQTRYEGWFIQKSDNYIKLLDRITLDNATVNSFTNVGSSVTWEFDKGSTLTWKLLSTQSGLTLTASRPLTLQLWLDIRDTYHFPSLGRTYEINSDGNGHLIRYTDPELAQPVFVHIRCSSPLTLHGNWAEQQYPRDEWRHSQPSQLFTYHLAEVTTDVLALGAGFSANEAERASLAASRQRPQPPVIGINHTHDTLMAQVSTARTTTEDALRLLQTQNGLQAGLPWFHQVWTRDELIASLGLSRDLQREVIDRYLGQPLQQGELPTFFNGDVTSSDGVGWLCLLIREFGEQHLNKDTTERLIHFLQIARKQLLLHRQAGHGLIFSPDNATWMDTIGRSGYRLEIQCMYALLLELLFSLTENPSYEQERLRFLGKIKHYYWQDTYLIDGLGDPSIRPNIFLAYLLQPDLLTANSWQVCFDTALKALSTSWGGLTSLDTTHPLFHAQTTGEDNQSYHNGDSWFFINNLAALAMQRLNQRYFGKYIVDILQSSTEEILWHNLAGHPGEISSADRLESAGCGLQAFSGGTYLALLKEMEDYSSGQEADASVAFWDSKSRSAADKS